MAIDDRAVSRRHRPDRPRPLGCRASARMVRAAAPGGARFWQDEAGRPRILVVHPLRGRRRDLEGLGDVLECPRRQSLMDLTPEQIEARMSMLDADPPYHTRLRSIVNKAFTPRAILAYEDRIRELVKEILDRAFEQEEFDYVADVSMETPMWVLCDIMGTPVADRQPIIELGDAMLGNTDPDPAGESRSGQADLSEYANLPFSSPAALEMFEYGHGSPRIDGRAHATTSRRGSSRRTPTATGSPSTSSTSSSCCCHRRQRDDASHRSATARTLCSRIPDQVERLAADPSLIPTRRRRDAALGRLRCSTSGERRPATSS